MMNQTDLAIFNQAVAIAQSQPGTAYQQLLSIEPNNGSDPSLLSWLIFVAPDYQDKAKWADRARSVAGNDVTVKAALDWFEKQSPNAYDEEIRRFQEWEVKQNKMQSKKPMSKLIWVLIGAVVIVMLAVFGFIFLAAKEIADPYQICSTSADCLKNAETGKKIKIRLDTKQGAMFLPTNSTDGNKFSWASGGKTLSIIVPKSVTVQPIDLYGKMIYVTLNREITSNGDWESTLDKFE